MKAKKGWELTGAAWEQTSQARLLRELDSVIPWKAWRQMATPSAPYTPDQKRELKQLLRLYVIQTVYHLPQEELERKVMGDPAMLSFMRLPKPGEVAARAAELPAFTARLAADGKGRQLSDALAHQVAQLGGLPEAAKPAPPPVPEPPRFERPAAPELPPQPVAAPPVRPVAPPSLPQDDADGSGWGRAAAAAPASSRRRRVKWWPIALLLILGVLGYLYGPGLYQQAQPWLRERFPNAVFLAAQPESTPSMAPALVAEQTPVTAPASTPRPNAYDASAQIARNLQSLSQTAPAQVLSREPELNKKAAVTFDGLLSKGSMLKILDIVGQHQIPVSFFPAGVQAAEAPDVIQAIAQAGYPVGNYTLRGIPHMESLSAEELVSDFSSAQKILEQTAGQAPTQLKGNALEYTDHVLKAAAASGLAQAVQPTAYLTFHSFKHYDEALAWVNRLPAGAIVTVKLSGTLDPSEYQPKEVVDRPAIDLESNLEVAPEPEPAGTPDERLLQVIGWLMRAIDESNFAPQTVALKEQNAGKLAPLVKELRTTQPAVGYAFYGDYLRPAEVEGLLAALAAIKGQGTFFVSLDNLQQSAEAIQTIHAAGHRVELLHTAVRDEDYFGAAGALYNTRQALTELLGEAPRLVLQAGGTVGDSLLEAASSLQLMPLAQDLSFAREESRAAASPEEVITAVYKTNTEGFQRGKVLGFRLGFYQQEDMLPRLIQALEGSRNVYAVTDIYQMATNESYLYTYPLPQAQILPEVYNVIHPGQLGVPESELIEVVRSRYIGNLGISTSKQLPGFSHQERSRIDQMGKVKGATNVVFLSFDDWGTDVGVTKLLRVLKAHDVKATFFVRTQFVPHNPNLLRAIALDGHEIASHTDTHFPLSNDLKQTWEFTELSDEQVEGLRQDILNSWQVLQSVVGDLRLDNGLPSLSRNFRPPTMAVGRRGFETVFDLGFDYVVNGEYTSKDYNAKSVAGLLDDLEHGIRSGSVVVMHFSDNVIYTADALDQYFTKIESGQRKAYSFARLSDYLKPLHSTPQTTDAADSKTAP